MASLLAHSLIGISAESWPLKPGTEKPLVFADIGVRNKDACLARIVGASLQRDFGSWGSDGLCGLQ